MTAINKKTLLILGNGFDLSLNLNSSYSAFYESEEFKKSDSIWQLLIPFMVTESKITNWIDIESAIKEVLINPEFGIITTYKDANFRSISAMLEDFSDEEDWEQIWDATAFPHLFNTCKEFPKRTRLFFFIITKLASKYPKESETLFRHFEQHPYEIDPYYLREDPETPFSELKKRYDANNERKYQEFLQLICKFLLSELVILEEAFSNFLNLQMASLPNYKEVADEKIWFLTDDHLPNCQTNPHINLYIYNFNYTSLTDQKIDCTLQSSEVGSEVESTTHYTQQNIIHNIHGRLDHQNIIFGIDFHADKLVKNTVHRKLVRPFTKASRKLRIYEPVLYKINTEFDKIIFFGHSLGEADFTHFKNIFDNVNLYSSNCELIFKYATNFGKPLGISKEKISQDIYDKVEQLLMKYQTTLRDDEQRENLFDRLILEGRILVKDIDDENEPYI